MISQKYTYVLPKCFRTKFFFPHHAMPPPPFSILEQSITIENYNKVYGLFTVTFI